MGIEALKDQVKPLVPKPLWAIAMHSRQLLAGERTLSYPADVGVKIGCKKATFRVSCQEEHLRVINLGWERDLIEGKLIPLLKPGSRCVFVGAHIGTHAVAAGLNKAEVYCFEPDPDIRRSLVRNLALNRISPSIVFPFAVLDKDCPVKLKTSGINGQAHRIEEVPNGNIYERIIEVPGTRLCSLVSKNLIPSSVKLALIDVEGAELLVYDALYFLELSLFVDIP